MPAQLRRNRAVTDPTEPGSTFKPFIASGAIEGSFVSLTEHIDCHMGVKAVDAANAHAAPDHTASASLETCNACHSTQMHARSGTAQAAAETAEAATPETLRSGFLATSPSPVSPLGYVAISILIGVACGFALAPLFQRSRRKGGK